MTGFADVVAALPLAGAAIVGFLVAGVLLGTHGRSLEPREEWGWCHVDEVML